MPFQMFLDLISVLNHAGQVVDVDKTCSKEINSLKEAIKNYCDNHLKNGHKFLEAIIAWQEKTEGS